MKFYQGRHQVFNTGQLTAAQVQLFLVALVYELRTDGNQLCRKHYAAESIINPIMLSHSKSELLWPQTS